MPAHDINLRYAVSLSSSYLTLGRDTPVQGIRLGYIVSESSI